MLSRQCSSPQLYPPPAGSLLILVIGGALDGEVEGLALGHPGLRWQLSPSYSSVPMEVAGLSDLSRDFL